MTFRQPAGWRMCQLEMPIKVRCTGWCILLTASPRSTSLTLLDGLGAFESAIANQSDVAGLSCLVPKTVWR